MKFNDTIILTPAEIAVGRYVGDLRREASRSASIEDGRHADGILEIDADGACAEIATAKYYGVYWEPSVNTFKRPDVGPFQVRSTSHQNGRLIVRGSDKPGDTFLLVITSLPTCRLVGCLAGSAAMCVRWRKKDAWWVPQEKLAPLPYAWEFVTTRR